MIARLPSMFRTVLAASGLILIAPVCAIAGIDVRLPQEINLLESGGDGTDASWAKYRVAIFSFEDQHDTGFGGLVADLIKKQILFDSTVPSLRVVKFKDGLSPTEDDRLSYFDKVEKLVEDQGYLISVWGRILPLKNELRIDTFVQLSDEAMEKNFSWRLKLPEAMGGQALVARLRPNRIRVQLLRMPTSEMVKLKNSSGNMRGCGWKSFVTTCRNNCGRMLEVADFAGGLLKYARRGKINNATDHLTVEALALEEQVKALQSLNLANIQDIEKRSLGRALRWTGSNRWTGKDKWTKINRGSGPAPGGSAFANVAVLANTAMALQQGYGEASASPVPWPPIRDQICSSGSEKFCQVMGRFTENGEFSGHLRIAEMMDAAAKAGSPPRQFRKFVQDELANAIFNTVTIDRDTVTQFAAELATASLNDPNNTDILKNLSVFFRFLGDRERYELADRILAEINRKQ